LETQFNVIQAQPQLSMTVEPFDLLAQNNESKVCIFYYDSYK